MPDGDFSRGLLFLFGETPQKGREIPAAPVIFFRNDAEPDNFQPGQASFAPYQADYVRRKGDSAGGNHLSVFEAGRAFDTDAAQVDSWSDHGKLGYGNLVITISGQGVAQIFSGHRGEQQNSEKDKKKEGEKHDNDKRRGGEPFPGLRSGFYFAAAFIHDGSIVVYVVFRDLIYLRRTNLTEQRKERFWSA